MGGAGLRLAACLSQDPPSQSPPTSLQKPDSFHATRAIPSRPKPSPILSKPTVSTNCCWTPNRATATTIPRLQSSPTRQGSPLCHHQNIPFYTQGRAPPLHCYSRNGVGRMLNANFCLGLHFVYHHQHAENRPAEKRSGSHSKRYVRDKGWGSPL